MLLSGSNNCSNWLLRRGHSRLLNRLEPWLLLLLLLLLLHGRHLLVALRWPSWIGLLHVWLLLLLHRVATLWCHLLHGHIHTSWPVSLLWSLLLLHTTISLCWSLALATIRESLLRWRLILLLSLRRLLLFSLLLLLTVLLNWGQLCLVWRICGRILLLLLPLLL